jgi:hypothetical protein
MNENERNDSDNYLNRKKIISSQMFGREEKVVRYAEFSVLVGS